jgi:phosphoadenosine phosphosulfate reductase
VTTRELRLVQQANASLANASPEAILRWTVDHFPRVGMTCSFSGTGIILAHLVAVHGLPIRVFFLDTGFHFPETLQAEQSFAQRYGLSVEVIRPSLSVEEQNATYGPELYRRDPDLCCHLRKVLPMQSVLDQLDAWVSGLRRDQSPARASTEVAELHTLPDGRVVVKVHPLAGWTRSQAWKYILDHDLPYNVLHDRGYPSIGCWPCTQPADPNGPERSGRWLGTTKTECGLHTFTRRELVHPVQP